MYVPADYDPSSDYNLFVSMHGLGDNSTAFRDFLVSNNFQNEFPNTIMVFVDGGDDNPARGHIDFEGEEKVIYDAIDTVVSRYSIDEDEIILHGFSYGGRSALKIGLDDPDKFKALYLSTPAIQGYNDLKNEEVGPLNVNYAYENASRIPIVITVGQEDLPYFRQNIGLLLELADNNGMVNILPLNGGHALLIGPGNAQILQLLEDPNSIDFGIQFFYRQGPRGYFCQIDDLGAVFFRNGTGDNISSLKFTLTAGSQTKIYDVNEELAPYESFVLELDQTGFDLPAGNYSANLTVTEMNGIAISNGSVGRQDINLNYTPEGTNDVITDNRTGEVDAWVNEPAFYTYAPIDAEVSGRDASVMFSHPFFFHNIGHAHTYYSPIVDVNGLQSKLLAMDYAFAYATYDAEGGGTLTITDTLIISYKADCDDNWTELYRASGDELATYGPIHNSTDLGSFLADPPSGSFDRLEVDLSGINSSAAQFKFDYMSASGGIFVLDRIKIGQIPGFVSDIDGLDVYPNPAEDFINIKFDGKLSDLQIVDMSGKIITAANSNEINIDGLPSGTYTLIGNADGKNFAKQIIKK
jgi:predicted esterase